MIDLHYWPTPNGHKITMFLEEAGLPYTDRAGEHRQGRAVRSPSSWRSRPTIACPAIVDHAPAGGGAPISRVRVRRDPAVPRGEDRQVHSRRPARPGRGDCSGCSGRWAASGRWPGRTITSRATRRRRSRTPIDRYVNETDRLYGVLEQAARRPRVRRRRTTRSRTWPPIRGSCRTSARARSSTTSRT